MLPTPSTSHINSDSIYEPAEDSYLLLDTLSSPSEINFLQERFHGAQGTTSFPIPLVLEVGTGSGVVLAFICAHANAIFGKSHVLAIGTDVNPLACTGAEQTVRETCTDQRRDACVSSQAASCVDLMGILRADLAAPIRSGLVDVLIFNPPYVPSLEVPTPQMREHVSTDQMDSDYLPLSYEGGVDGMEITSRLLNQLPQILNKERGVAYILLCAQNKPDKVADNIRNWGASWIVDVVGKSGKTGGWEKLQILRIRRK